MYQKISSFKANAGFANTNFNHTQNERARNSDLEDTLILCTLSRIQREYLK